MQVPILSSSTDRPTDDRVRLLRVCGPNLQSVVSKPLFNSHAHLQSMGLESARDQAREGCRDTDRIRERDRDWQGMQLWTQLEIRQGKDAEIQIAYGRLARHAIVDAARDQARKGCRDTDRIRETGKACNCGRS